MKNLKEILIPLIIAFCILMALGVLVYVNQGTKKTVPGKEILPPQEAAEKAIKFINQEMLTEEIKATLLNVSEESDVYKVQIKVGEEKYDAYMTKDGKIFFDRGFVLEKSSQAPEKVKEEGRTIGNFSIAEGEICRENEKPIVYFFGSERCAHCLWQHPVLEKAAKKFEGYISFHDNMNTDKDMEVFKKYSTGGVPTIVLGCQYYRVGSGEGVGEEQETKILTALLCKLTDKKPENVCKPVEDLINQIAN